MVMWLIFGAGVMCGAAILGLSAGISIKCDEKREARTKAKQEAQQEKEYVNSRLTALSNWSCKLENRVEKIETAAKKKARRK